MGRIARTLKLAKTSYEVLKADGELLVLPFLSLLSALVVGATFVIPTLLLVDQANPITYVIAFVAYVVLAYVTIFFNTALVSAADERLQGGDPTVRSALGGAARRAGRIFPWAVISATVSLLLRALEQRTGVLGRIVASLGGIAWALVTFLVIPVLVVEDVSVPQAIRRSGQLFKRTWGENVVATVGFGLLGFVAALPAIAVIVLAAFSSSTLVTVGAIVLGALWMVGLTVVLSALNAIFQTALYRYAVDGRAVGPFSSETMGSVFSTKH